MIFMNIVKNGSGYKNVPIVQSERNCEFCQAFKYRFLISILMLTGIISTIKAQTFTTPEAYSFKQEVFRPISYYTGQANISIPLCEIKTNEITIPVTLSYVGGEGLRAINPYSSVGLGWKISAGGAITRSLNGSPDEYNTSGTGKLLGFFGLTPNTVTNDYVRNNASTFLVSDGSSKVKFISRYEYSPDVFSFSFLGLSGFFVMGYDGQFRIQSQDVVSVEKLSSSLTGIGDNPVYFRLTGNDGTQYSFGSTVGSVEFSGGNYAGVPYLDNAWYLSQIKFTNGRIISFNYQQNLITILRYRSSSGQSDPFTCNPVVLDKITYNGGTVVFTSSNLPHSITDSSRDQLRLINAVELWDENNQRVSQVNLKYSARPYTTTPRYYTLDSLRVDNKRYALGYNSTNSLPNMTQSFGNDYWGFYNGQNEKTGRIGRTYRDQYLNQTLTITEKLPSETYAKIGILTSLTYPTGETEYYEYEQNKYSKTWMQNETSGNILSNTYGPQNGGGLRISSITLGNQVRQYKYATSFDPNNPDNVNATSSGILYKIPAVCCMSAEAINFLSIEGEPPMVYSKVVEYLSDKSYTEYNMNSPQSRPDGDNSQNPNYYTVWANYPNIFNWIKKPIFVCAVGKNSSCSLERGQVSEVKVYDSSNVLKKSTVYTYASNPNRYNQYVSSIYYTDTSDQRMAWLGYELGGQYLSGNTKLAFTILHSYCIYTFPAYLDQESTTEYIGANTVQRITKYRYNNQKLRSAVVTFDSMGDSIRTLYRYPADINSGNYAAMTTKKMLNFPIEQTTWKKNYITGGKLTTYKANGSYFVPDQIYNMEVQTPFTSMSPDFNGTGKDIHYGSADITFDSYSSSGSVRQTTGRDGTTTAYLWDSYGNYPMAQVKGAAYSQISSLDAKVCSYSSSTLWNEINGQVPSAFISTYSYKPLVGAKSITNPANVTTNYTYNINNKPYLVRDDDKNIMQLYRYCYRNFPENGNGGYPSMTGSIPTPPLVIKNTPSTSTANVSGGSGSYTYNWYLKNSSGTVVASTLNSTSSSYAFTCTQFGSYSIQCVVVDNSLGNQLTIYSSNFACSGPICSFSMYYGFSNLSNSILNMGTTASFYISFYSLSDMRLNVSYLIATISASCKPSSNRVFKIDSVMGRSWEITITSFGEMYWKMTRGTTMPAYYSESTGTMTYNL